MSKIKTLTTLILGAALGMGVILMTDEPVTVPAEPVRIVVPDTRTVTETVEVQAPPSEGCKLLISHLTDMLNAAGEVSDQQGTIIELLSDIAKDLSDGSLDPTDVVGFKQRIRDSETVLTGSFLDVGKYMYEVDKNQGKCTE